MSALPLKWKAIKAKFAEVRAFLVACFEGKTNSGPLDRATVRKRSLARGGYTLLFATLTALIIGRSHQPRLPRILPQVGDLAEQNFVSPLSVEIEPRDVTPQERQLLARRIAPIFDYDDTTMDTWIQRWRNAFSEVREEFYSKRRPNREIPDGLPAKITELTGQVLRVRDIQLLHERKFDKDTEEVFVKIGEFLKGRIIAEKDLFPIHYATGITVRQVNQRLQETQIQDVSRIWSLDQAREVLGQLPKLLKNLPTKLSKPLSGMVANLIPANLIPNEALTQKRLSAFLASTRPPVISLREGQFVVNRGDRITEQNLEVLRSLKELTSPTANLKRFSLTLVILLFFFSMLFQMGVSGKMFWDLPLKDAMIFMLSQVSTVALIKLGYVILQMRFSRWTEGYGLEYLIPVSAGAVIIHLMMGKAAAYTYSLATSIVVGFMLDQHFFFSVWALTVNAAAIESIQSCKQRTDLFKAGVFSGMIGALLVLAFSLINVMGFKNPDWSAIFLTVTLALVSGILSPVITSSLIPFVESIFGYTTSLKLLELSNFNHPLLHNLMMKAPGTYHHSVIVGSLAELAADRIGANALLARVAAYYHDIGKMNKPLYFIENQAPNNNPHDHLTPSISAKILFAHVKNGVKLGKEHALGNTIVDIIEQHHGTTLTNYFFNKAKQGEDPDLEHVHESDFRYPGPKPQTREAGIVMLADACEAATRSIADPTPHKIEVMVKSIIEKRFLEEQFSDCDLTQRELQVIRETFTRTLVSLYHHRVEYPGQKNIIPPSGPQNDPQKAQNS